MTYRVRDRYHWHLCPFIVDVLITVTEAARNMVYVKATIVPEGEY